MINTSSKTGGNDNSGSSKEESREKRPSKSSTQEPIDKFAQIMITGFHDLKNVFQRSVDQGDYSDDEVELDAESEDFPECVELDLFQQVTLEFQSKDGAGPEVVKSLAFA